MNLGREMLEAEPRPTAVLVASDPMAVGVYKAINEAHLRIPEDISVVSFDDIEITYICKNMENFIDILRDNIKFFNKLFSLDKK